MISLVQVVAAMAAGALVAISFVLVLKVHELQCRTRPDEEASLERQPQDQVERESRIDATALIAIDLFETIRSSDADRVHVQQPRAEVREIRPLPDTTAVVRSKGHLKLIGGGVAALLSFCAGVRAAMRAQQAQIIGSAVGGVSVVSAVTVLTLTPWTMDGQMEPPAPTPSATWSHTATQPSRNAPQPAATAMPKRSATPSPRSEAPSPSPSPSSTRLVSPTTHPSPAAPSSAAEEAPAPAASGTADPTPGQPAQPGITSPSASHSEAPTQPASPQWSGWGHRHQGGCGR